MEKWSKYLPNGDINPVKEYPSSTKPVMFQTRFILDPETGMAEAGVHEGFYIKDANKFTKGINRWKDTKEDKWYDNEDVIGWWEVKKA